ncbi:protein NRT1/ PTR FAMILY 2.9-like [Ananas comosus]|uniref:Protein NRT1/ PTR FAMILY 2.9-like n=1 Tax=Ananas comosus TaxID=4615 RepID=A0A6P5FQY7_ANACO|nr:protein NRT1/ PTR FAMILY 2.9-like [Ananas comosus]
MEDELAVADVAEGRRAAAKMAAAVAAEVTKEEKDGDTAAAAAAAAAEKDVVVYRGWKTMPYIIGNETFEKLGSIGTAMNLMVYLTDVFHMTNVDAATTLNVFSGTTNLATVVGAFVSDSYLGRYTTVGLGCVASFVGMVILTLTAGVPTLHPSPCAGSSTTIAAACAHATKWQLAVLVAAFTFIVVGAGGIRPCNLAFGADQFDPATPAGRRGVNSFFNWYYFTFTIAVGFSSTVIIYVQSNVSWWLGFALPALLMLLSCFCFFAGATRYVKVPPEGSPFTGLARVAVAAYRKRHLRLPSEPEKELFRAPHKSSLVSKLPYTDQFKFVDKAAIVAADSEIAQSGMPTDKWSLCSLQQVEEAKCILRTIPVWATGIIYYIAFAQTTTYVVLQAVQSDRRIGRSGFEIPPASFTIFPMLALTIWIPCYDRVLLPWLRKIKGTDEGITLLQRMGIGIVLSVLAMVVSGFVEQQRRSYAIHRPTFSSSSSRSGLVSSFSSLWLIPQLIILGLSEAFNHVSQLEFYYKQFPENMRSIAGSLLFSGIALSNYVSGLLVTIVHRTTGGYEKDSWLPDDLNKGRLDLFYFLIAIMGALNFVGFVACAKWYRYKALDGDRNGGDNGGDDSQSAV